jgi:hypothetical protein
MRNDVFVLEADDSPDKVPPCHKHLFVKPSQPLAQAAVDHRSTNIVCESTARNLSLSERIVAGGAQPYPLGAIESLDPLEMNNYSVVKYRDWESRKRNRKVHVRRLWSEAV